jgi:subtilase family serine protease
VGRLCNPLTAVSKKLLFDILFMNYLFSRNKSINSLYRNFQWKIPPLFNIGIECVDRHVSNGQGGKIAIIEHATKRKFTFQDLKHLTDSFALGLQNEYHITKGDTVAI